jgi:hypothetical protein
MKLILFTIISVMNHKTVDMVLMISDPIFGCMQNCGNTSPISIIQMYFWMFRTVSLLC